MTTQPKRTVAFALCGSFCSFSAVLPQVRLLAARGWDVLPILRTMGFRAVPRRWASFCSGGTTILCPSARTTATKSRAA